MQHESLDQGADERLAEFDAFMDALGPQRQEIAQQLVWAACQELVNDLLEELCTETADSLEDDENTIKVLIELPQTEAYRFVADVEDIEDGVAETATWTRVLALLGTMHDAVSEVLDESSPI